MTDRNEGLYFNAFATTAAMLSDGQRDGIEPTNMTVRVADCELLLGSVIIITITIIPI